MPSSKYDNYGGGSSGGQSYDNEELRFEINATVVGEFGRVFGTESQYGQSLGVNMTNVRLDDGLIYYYPDQDRYKMFPWEQVCGFSPWELADRDDMSTDIDDQADTIHTESYGDGTQRYELVMARMPEVVDDDGTVLIEAQSKSRGINVVDGELQGFTEWEDHDGARIGFHDTITWWDGSNEYGPNTTAVTLLETLTHFGQEAAVDDSDIFNWLPDTSGENMLRDDLDGREVEFFIIQRPGEEYSYNVPVILDVETGEQIRPDNRAASTSGGGGSGNENSGGESQLQAARAEDAEGRSYPEPVADYIQAAQELNMDRESAGQLLDDVVADNESMDPEMVEEVGGREHLIDQVV